MRLPRWLAIVLFAAVLALLWWVMRDPAPDPDPGPAGSGSAMSPSDIPDPSAAQGPSGTDTRDWDGIDACHDDDLPAELEPVVWDVQDGGPFDHPDRDGSTFGNFEELLPDEQRGYYREYTVRTPGLDHRGAKRIVAGGQATDPEVWYYTDDHYESFCEFAP